MTETYLAAAANLRGAGLETPMVFVSTNVKDYAVERRSRLKPDLEAEFQNLGMEYAASFGAAKHLLGF